MREHSPGLEQAFEKLGQRVRLLRVERGLTQEDMMDFGFSVRFYQRIEAGKSISIKTAFKLAEAFKVSLGELFQGL